MKRILFVLLTGCVHAHAPIPHGDIAIAEFKAVSCCLVDCRDWENPDIVEVCQTQCIAEERAHKEE